MLLGVILYSPDQEIPKAILTMPMRKNSRLLPATIILTVLMTLLTGCAIMQKGSSEAEKTPADSNQPDTILAPNEVLTARTKSGLIKVEAGPYPMRIFSLEGARQGGITETGPQLQYDNSSRTLTFDGRPDVWVSDHGIKKLHYTEGHKNFSSTADARDWLQQQPLDYVYNNQGLAAGWQSGDEELQVAVWQLTVNGQNAVLPGSHNDRIATQSVDDMLNKKPEGWFKRHIVDPITRTFNSLWGDSD